MIAYNYPNIGGASSEEEVILDDIFQFREMPAIPLSHTHGKGVDVLIELV